MRKLVFAIMAMSGLSMFPTAALADVFNGVCTFTGTAHLSPPAQLLLQSGTFTFTTDGGPNNKCTGKLNGVTITNARSWAVANGSGKLSCSASNGKGTGTLYVNGVPIGFKLTIVGTGPQVTIDITGNAGGTAVGQASFATDGSAAGDCKDKDASDLTFIIAASAALLKD